MFVNARPPGRLFLLLLLLLVTQQLPSLSSESEDISAYRIDSRRENAMQADAVVCVCN
jgi:hypothetical protein